MLLTSAFLLALAVYGLWVPDLGFGELQKRYGSTPENVVSIDNMRIHYKDTGPKDAPVLLLLHGFGSSLQTWDDWAEKLDQKYKISISTEGNEDYIKIQDYQITFCENKFEEAINQFNNLFKK